MVLPYSLPEIGHWLTLFLTRIFCQPIQAFGITKWAENFIGWIVVSAGGLARSI
jgi:hypothetical protein